MGQLVITQQKKNQNYITTKPMENKKQTALDELIKQIDNEEKVLMGLYGAEMFGRRVGLSFARRVALELKAMEKEQMGYTKEDVLMAGFIGEINHFDTKHIVSLLDEAKQYNETHGDK